MYKNKLAEGSRYIGVNYSVLVVRAGHLAVTGYEGKRKEWLHAFFINK